MSFDFVDIIQRERVCNLRVTGSFKKFLALYFRMEELKYNQFYISRFQIRRVWSEWEWWYCITDVISYLTKSKDPIEYVVKLRARNPIIQILWDKKVKRFLIKTKEGRRISNCCNLCFLLDIVSIIPRKYRWRFRVLKLRIESLIQ